MPAPMRVSLSTNCVERVTSTEVIGHDATDLGDVPFADATQGFNERDNFSVAGQTIENTFAPTLCLHQARPPENLEMTGGIGKAEM